MSGQQRTLFQTWGSKVSRSAGAPSCSSRTELPRGPGNSTAHFRAAAQEAKEAEAAEAQPESDDDVLLVAVYEAERQLSLENGGFCTSAGALWIYPTNCPVRDYQLRIARTALFCNTLVCLPTGLGKTFIAAVVMYNFYRWFPSGKVVFMAPTKPLVTQQIEACYRVMGIPQSHMAEMTGSTQVFTRKEIWGSKRVIFLTPQVMINDLSRGACPAVEIKCLVIDEAHKALGNYAYCQVVRELVKYTNHFRILALSATPGSDIKAVQQVITNLLIGQIELRSEDSSDILPYSHERRVEKIVVPLGEELSAIQKAYIQILEAFASSLIQRNVLMRRDIPNLTKYQIILARDQFRKNPSPNIVGMQQGIIEGEFAICISLYHGYELLQQMGMRSLYFFLCGIMDGTKGMTRAKNELSRNEAFMKLYNHLECIFAHTRSSSASGISAIQKGDEDKKFCYSHPKLKKLEEVVVEHFKSWNAQNRSEKKCDETRVMIFSSFRDSVQEIAEMLLQHQPVIRVMTFVGHASGKSMKGFTQKEQLEVVKQFRSGGYNTLVSTCVGEEGLDIGEVDLIICFDAQKSPIRLVQRMGRTGRKRQGRIVVILAEGREERTYNQSQSNKRSIYKAISGNKQVLHFYQGSPRMVPDGINPQLHKMFITHGVFEPEKPSRNLQRKSSIFSHRNEMRQSNSKKDWFLSEEEFKLWNKRYRLRDSDGTKEITLPQVQFLSLQNENRQTQEPTIGIHQLSLSEWRLWQDHPLPTYQVDHSDRCHHFINIMQMIEGMRHEEGECSYELEVKSYLQMEDVSSTSSVPRHEYNPFAYGTFASNKKSSFTKNINQGKSFSMTESSEECAEVFKQTRIKPTKIVSLKKKASKELKKDQPKKEKKDVVMEPLDTDSNSIVENICQVDLLNDERTLDTDEVTATCASNENVANQSCELLTECQFTSKSTSSFTGNSDSGYNSLSDEKSLSSTLLLPFEDELYIAGIDDQFYHGHSLTSEVLANIERFLSHSPPPLSGLSRLEYEIAKGSAPENLLFLPYTEHLQKDKSTCLMSYSAVNSQENLEFSLTAHPSEKSCIYGTTNDKISDESSFCDYDKVHKGIKNENLVSSNHMQVNIGPPKYFVEEKNHDVDNDGLPILHTDQDESLLLFDDVNTEFNDVSLSPLNSKCKSLCVSDKNAINDVAPVSQFFISDELLLDDNSEPQDQIICDTNNWKSHEDLRGVHEEKLKNDEYGFDCSKDLFSVTFDLGFCSPDSDDEVLEHAPDTNKNKFLDHLSGRCLDTKETSDANYVSDQAGHVDSSTGITITIPSSEDKRSPTFAHFPMSAAKNKEFMSPGYSQFSLPVGEKVMSTPLSESNTLNSLSKKKLEMARTSDSNKGKVNLQSSKETLHSTFDDSGLSVEKTKSREQINLRQSCHSGKDEQLTSSESEDEIFQRRIKKTKGNVLDSPEDQKNSEVDSPLHAVKKHRVPPNRLDFSSSDESENFHKRDLQSEDFKDLNRKDKKGIRVRKRQSHLKLVARKFLDDEAELSQEDAECVSSDENDESENEQDSSLLDFLNDETQLSQAINDAEMRAVYMKSLRSPLMSNQYRMFHKKRNNVNVFSQIPEQDETYLEDSFCVDEEESCKSQSSEEVCVDFNITEDSFASGSKKYKTRRAVKLKQMKMRENCARLRKKLFRIILPDDSSEDEDNVNDKRESNTVVNPSTVNKSEQKDHCWNLVPSGSSLQSKDHSTLSVNRSPKQRQQTPLNLKATVSDVSDFKPQSCNKIESTSPSFTTVDSQKDCRKFPIQLKNACALEDSGTSMAYCSNSRPHLAGTHASLRLPQEGQRTCILVDSREITCGSEVISSLRAIHGLQVEVCPLNGCDYIVSNRMAVERRSQSEMLNSINKNKLIDQIQHLQGMFERICVIVEKDREKTGDTSRMFRRTKSYDSLLTTLIGAGIRILFSSCQEETADLLKELSLVEQRKNVGIHVPTVVNSNKCEALQFYLSIPNISYITALNMCHQFSSVKKMTNSSLQEISMCAQVTHQKAEEIYRYIHYIFDMQMLPNDLNQGRFKSDA
ncbi:Fanconi anemia group M protein [Camelus dromedarius]|uniref:Fanconi anemia group M protein n=1 Tax=Camelus dromedarius TaxID=9838 RepID=UPI00057BA555|nr:Fanconi anemia group M protein [Camelus dromedarius]XP_031309522.1 Fanconi anemia group M protein [Camelus dromedarius]